MVDVSGISKEEASRRVAENVVKVNELLASCRKLCDEHDIYFVYNYASECDTGLEEGYAEFRWESSNC